VSFLVSLLLPVLAAALYFRGYLERAAQGRAPVEISAGRALGAAAISGAAALVFLSLLGVMILFYRGRTITPPDLGDSAAIFWVTQFVIAAAIGGALGAVTGLAMLPWLRARLARLAATASA
jgi:hypothetical protein